jgi:hypothetical protein
MAPGGKHCSDHSLTMHHPCPPAHSTTAVQVCRHSIQLHCMIVAYLHRILCMQCMCYSVLYVQEFQYISAVTSALSTHALCTGSRHNTIACVLCAIYTAFVGPKGKLLLRKSISSGDSASFTSSTTTSSSIAPLAPLKRRLSQECGSASIGI